MAEPSLDRRAGTEEAARPGAAGESFPLSLAQQRVWILDKLWPGQIVYNVPLALHLRGALDTACLRSALEELFRRHEVLRSRFPEVDGEGRQVIDSDAPLPFEQVDLQTRPEALDGLMHSETVRPVDLANGPIARVILYRLAPAHHVLFVATHHIVIDGRSVNILLRDLAALYGALLAGDSLPPETAKVRYGDFALRERADLEGDTLEREIGYWKGRLAGAPVAADLPTDRPRPPVRSFRGGSHEVEIPAGLAKGLRGLARSEGVTLFTVLMAAYQTLLSRWSGQEDLVVGVPVAGRRQATEELVGFFVNIVPLRTDLSGMPSFRELVRRVKAGLAESFEHQALPFEKLLEAVAPARDLSRPPIFQASLNYRSFDAASIFEPLGLGAELERRSTGTVKFDLDLTLEWRGDVILCRFEYATDLFFAATIARMAGHYLALLEGAVATPDLAVAQLPMVGGEERHRLLSGWNDTAAPIGEPFVHLRIAGQAAKTPDAVAATFGEASLTYAELEADANRLAHHLRHLGVGPDVPVALCLDRSTAMLVGILAVLKAGGAYVPIDPTGPVERVAFMLDDSSPALVLADARGRAALQAASKSLRSVPLMVDPAADSALWADRPATPPDPAGLAPGHIAYIIYTSGSTGAPKGVMVEHRNLANHTSWFNRQFGLRPDDRVLQRTPCFFDASVWEIFSTLAAGAQLRLIPSAEAAEPAALARHFAAGATIVQCVPVLLEALLAHGAFESGPALRTVFCGGDVLTSAAARQFARQTGADLVNLYGPTEATIEVSWHRCRGQEEEGLSVPVGRPAANTRLYILDPWGQPAPQGVPGELHIGGASLARGYWRRPDLTAERFVPDPFAAGERLYRTGDLARYRPDGSIDFLGRNDFQAKIRGFRVELGEIEARLREDPAVREAVVVTRELKPGEVSLVAYVVPASRSASAAGLIAALKPHLPHYMLPSACLLLDALPLLPNGKLDRAALPAPAAIRPEARFVAPRNPLEETLAAIWQDVLHVERVGMDDDFFELRGQSLQAMRIASRVRQSFGIDLPVRLILEARTIGRLAANPVFAPDRPAKPVAPPPVAAAEDRLWFLKK